MRIGTRWSVGEPCPAALPAPVLEAIAAEEAELARLGADTATWGWTLTYLEGSPIVELDDGTRVTLDDDTAHVSR